MISIITPSFNRLNTLSRVYESIRYQNTPFEWVVVDDASTDGTVEYIESLMSKDQRVRLVRLEINGGVNKARMAGVHYSTQPYIFFLDSDDVLLPDATKTLLAVSEDLKGSVAVGVLPTSSHNDEENKNGFGLYDEQILGEYEIVCERRLEKELSYLYRRDVFDFQQLPIDMRGCEFIFVYGLSRKYLFIAKNTVVRGINRQSDNLSSSSGVVARSGEIGLGYIQIVRQHENVLKHSAATRTGYIIKAAIRIKMAGIKYNILSESGIKLSLVELLIVHVIRLLPSSLMLQAERMRISRINYKTFGKD
jgi:glycosyltransferase involved in cell wall biosynthesis